MKKIILSCGGISLIIEATLFGILYFDILPHTYPGQDQTVMQISFVIVFLVPIFLGLIGMVKDRGIKRYLGVLGLVVGILWFWGILLLMGGSGF